MNDETKEETMLSNEEIIEALKKYFKWMIEQSEVIYGTKENPYYFLCNNNVYKQIKELLPLDKNDMYCYYGGRVKIVNVDKAFEKIEAKPYEVKDNPFCNTFKKPFYQDLFEQDKRKYGIQVKGKWRKRK